MNRWAAEAAKRTINIFKAATVGHDDLISSDDGCLFQLLSQLRASVDVAGAFRVNRNKNF